MKVNLDHHHHMKIVKQQMKVKWDYHHHMKSENEIVSSPTEQDGKEDLEIEDDNIEQDDKEVENDTTEEDTGVVDKDKSAEIAGVIENAEGPKQNNNSEITGVSDSESTGVPNATINNGTKVDNSELDGQDNSP
eukprot:12681050-Ditylum_brightwellii.AAC.1